MKLNFLIVALVLCLLGVLGNAHEDVGPEKHIHLTPNEIEWKDGPKSLEEGAKYAVLEGDPAKAGFFTMRIKLPDGFRIAPHWHPNVERLTILSGNFYLGHGEKFDKEKAKLLVEGSYTSMPPKMRHFAYVKGETVIQLTTIGPWEINYLNPDDDPRLRD